MERAWPLAVAAGLLLLSGCGETIVAKKMSDDILDDFQRVNADLDALLMTPDSLAARGYRKLTSSSCPEAEHAADSLHHIRMVLDAAITTFKEKLVGSAMDNTVIADSVFKADGFGDRLHQDLLTFYAQAKRITAGDSTAAPVAQLASSMEDPDGPETWRTRNFHRAPAAVARSILSYHASNISKAEEICLDKLLRDCTGKGLR